MTRTGYSKRIVRARSLFDVFNSSDNQPVEIAFSDFVHQVESQQIEIARVSQTQKDLYALTEFRVHEHVILPSKFDIIGLLLEHNVDVAIIPWKDMESMISTWLLFIIQAAVIFFIIRSIARSGGPMGGVKGFTQSQSSMDTKPITNVSFDDIAGIEQAKADLKEIVDFLKTPEKYVEVGAKVPKGVMLYGPPGTGKTLLAKAVAGEAGVPFISCSGSDFMEMFVGVGASRVRDVFKKAAENAPCIVFIDEIDTIGKKRGGGMGNSGNDERDQTINQLLTLMDGFQENNGVIVMAATNRIDILDDALLRPGRFDRRVMVELPDFRGRQSILKIHTKGKPLDGDVSIETLSKNTVGFSGADLANLCNEAAIYAARDTSKTIAGKHFDQALEKIILGEEKRTLVITEQKKKVLAYHEGGHALLGILLKDYDVVRKVSIVPRGKAGGVTYFEPSEERVDMGLMTKEYFEHRIMVALGGRIAEELIFGRDNMTTGASGDIMEVYKLAYQMVAMYGFSDKLGPVYWVESAKKEEIDSEVKELVDVLYTKSKQMMKENINNLHRIANELLEKENITKEDLERIVR